MRSTYHFSILRYVHDAVTQEFVNIGVAVYAPDRGYAGVRVSSHYSRLTRMFTGVDGERYRQLVRYIETAIQARSQDLLGLPMERLTMEAWLARVLPQDDSALQFSKPAAGIADDLQNTLNALYRRYVETYLHAAEPERRDDNEVWRSVYRVPLQRLSLASRLQPKEIVAKDLTHEFPQAWKNGVWHVCETVSFDLLESQSITDKAARWRGRLEELREGSERFVAHLLLGAPADRKLRSAYAKAENILGRAGKDVKLVREDEAEQFAESVADDFRTHSG